MVRESAIAETRINRRQLPRRRGFTRSRAAFLGRVYALRHGGVYRKQGRDGGVEARERDGDSIARADESARVLAFPCTDANMRYSIVR